MTVESELDFGPECVIELVSGGSLRCPPFPADCDYVRVCNHLGNEVAYWTHEEWREDPVVVMGAILGAARGI